MVVPAGPGLDIGVLRRCLQSIDTGMQAHQGECIVVCDGKPSWDAQQLTDTYRFQLTVLEQEQRGVSAARNKGMKACSGAWIAFVDADDVVTEGALDELCDYAQANDCDMVMGAYQDVLGTTSETQRYVDHDALYSGDDLKEFRCQSLCPQRRIGLVWAKLYCADVLQNLAFDESLVLGEDAVFVFNVCAKAERIGYLNQIVYQYIRSTSSTVRAFREDYADLAMRAVAAMDKTVRAQPDSAVYEPYLDTFALFQLTVVMVNYLFHPQSGWSAQQRRTRYREVINTPCFRGPLKRFKGERFSLTRVVSLYTMKYRMYLLSAAIAAVRQRQFAQS